MTPIQTAFEALMPKVAFCRVGDVMGPCAPMVGQTEASFLYTADQMRQAIQAASDLAAKREREECHRLVEMFPCHGVDGSEVVDAITQIAAAIRARDGGMS